MRTRIRKAVAAGDANRMHAAQHAHNVAVTQAEEALTHDVVTNF